MIVGIGTDMIEIERVAKAAQNPTFLRKVYASEEEAEKRRPESLAAHFAAKEAVAKALGVGLSGISLSEIMILNEENGRPRVELSGKALALADSLDIGGWLISLSHSKGEAVAFVIAIRRD